MINRAVSNISPQPTRSEYREFNVSNVSAAEAAQKIIEIAGIEDDEGSKKAIKEIIKIAGIEDDEASKKAIKKIEERLSGNLDNLDRSTEISEIIERAKNDPIGFVGISPSLSNSTQGYRQTGPDLNEFGGTNISGTVRPEPVAQEIDPETRERTS